MLHRSFGYAIKKKGRRQGYNCNLGTRGFLVAGPVGRPNWKVTGPQLQSGNSRVFWWQATGLQVQPGYSRFFGGRRQGYKCNLGTRDFLVAGPVGSGRAPTAIWKLEIFWWQAQLQVPGVFTIPPRVVDLDDRQCFTARSAMR